MIEAPPQVIRVRLHQWVDLADDDPSVEYTADTVWPVGFPIPKRGQEIELDDISGPIARVIWKTDRGIEPYCISRSKADDARLPRLVDHVCRMAGGSLCAPDRVDAVRAEFEWAEVPYPVTQQGQSTGLDSDDDEHGPHVFLYVPDYSAETRWSTHRVPERKSERAEKRDMGFRR